MSVFTRITERRSAKQARKNYLAYECACNSGCQMLQDAFDTFPNRVEAISALKKILSSRQTPDENEKTGNWFGQTAHEQQRRHPGALTR